MSNKETFKNILKAVKQIFVCTKDIEMDDQLIEDLRVHTEPIMTFFRIGHFESVILSLYIEYTLRDVEVDMNKVINHFGRDISVVADINEAIDELFQMKLISVRESEFTSKQQSKFNQNIQLSPKALDAMIKGDAEIFFTNNIQNFLSLVEEASELICKRRERKITTDILLNDIKALIEANMEYPEVQWILSHNNIDYYDITILLGVTSDILEGYYDVDIDNIIQAVFSRLTDQIAYKRTLKENKNFLLVNEIIEFSTDMFAFLNYIKLSEEALDNLLGGNKESVVKAYVPKMGIIIQADQIKPENLFYNYEEKEQIDILTEALEEKNYHHLMSQLKDNGMKEGFTVLLHGYPGTGKTSSVKQIAKATGRNIFIVEIDRILSKWVGESEKNISKIFDEYNKCKKSFSSVPILLFNEADAILGKRINISNSVDKSFNTFQNLLLQELEDFEGIFMATTNLANQLDDAFDRRLLYKIEFKKPDENVRRKILKNSFAGIADPVIDKLNHYALTGGQISNVKKKLLVYNILKNSQLDPDYLVKLCEAELSMSKKLTNSIGFIKSRVA